MTEYKQSNDWRYIAIANIGSICLQECIDYATEMLAKERIDDERDFLDCFGGIDFAYDIKIAQAKIAQTIKDEKCLEQPDTSTQQQRIEARQRLMLLGLWYNDWRLGDELRCTQDFSSQGYIQQFAMMYTSPDKAYSLPDNPPGYNPYSDDL